MESTIESENENLFLAEQQSEKNLINYAYLRDTRLKVCLTHSNINTTNSNLNTLTTEPSYKTKIVKDNFPKIKYSYKPQINPYTLEEYYQSNHNPELGKLKVNINKLKNNFEIINTKEIKTLRKEINPNYFDLTEIQNKRKEFKKILDKTSIKEILKSRIVKNSSSKIITKNINEYDIKLKNEKISDYHFKKLQSDINSKSPYAARLKDSLDNLYLTESNKNNFDYINNTEAPKKNKKMRNFLSIDTNDKFVNSRKTKNSTHISEIPLLQSFNSIKNIKKISSDLKGNSNIIFIDEDSEENKSNVNEFSDLPRISMYKNKYLNSPRLEKKESAHSSKLSQDSLFTLPSIRKKQSSNLLRNIVAGFSIFKKKIKNLRNEDPIEINSPKKYEEEQFSQKIKNLNKNFSSKYKNIVTKLELDQNLHQNRNVFTQNEIDLIIKSESKIEIDKLKYDYEFRLQNSINKEKENFKKIISKDRKSTLIVKGTKVIDEAKDIKNRAKRKLVGSFQEFYSKIK